MSELVCEAYKKMVSKPETSSTYNNSLKIMAEIAANKDKKRLVNYVSNVSAVFNTATKESDNLLRPKYYGGDYNPYEVFNVLEAWGLDKDFYLGNVIKYIARAGKKDATKELEDLEKAEVYLKRRITELKK
jgi:hypothetical protein